MAIGIYTRSMHAMDLQDAITILISAIILIISNLSLFNMQFIVCI